jgi:hypothetical protein
MDGSSDRSERDLGDSAAPRPAGSGAAVTGRSRLDDRPVRQSRPTGHVFRLEKARGPSWWAKYRLANGTQVKKKIGPAWTGRGRPPSG